MIIKGARVINFLYIQLLNYCIYNENCFNCYYRSDSTPCTLFSGIFEDLDMSGATAEFESIFQAKMQHKENECCTTCIFGVCDGCGMVQFTKLVFFNGIMVKRDKK